MLRALLILAQLLALAPQGAWAAMGRSSGPRGGLPVLPLELPGPAPAPVLPPSLPSVSPAAMPADLAYQAILNAPAQPAAAALPPAARALPLAPAPARALAPARQVEAAGIEAARLLDAPASPETDARRADFTLLAAPRPDLDAPFAGLAGASAPSGLTSAPASPERAGPESPAVPPPGKPGAPAPARGVWSYLGGVFTAQVANNALVVTLPLVLLGLGQSLAAVGLVTAVTTGVDMAGTLASGWLTDRLGARKTLIAATALRAAALSVLPVLLAAGALTPALAVGLFVADALGRGIADTARNTVPLLIAGKDKPALDALNSKYQTAFELGAVAGPLIVGLLMLKQNAGLAHWLVAGTFAAAAALYLRLPRASAPTAAVPAGAAAAAAAPPWLKRLQRVLADKWLRLGLLTMVLLSLSPALKALLPAFFAETLLASPGQAAWLVLAYGLGGAAGSLLYNRLHGRLGLKGWLSAGAVGTLLLALGPAAGAFWPMAAASLLFALANVAARLSLTSSLQQRIPDGAEGGVMGLVRFSANMTSMGLRFAVGLAFAAASPGGAFALVGAGLAAFALAQLWASRRLTALALAAALPAASSPALSPAHGLPGRLIVFEGLDGSGKSTQLELVRDRLEAQGLKVVVTTWNSSEVVSEAVKRGKKAKALEPRTFSLLHASDLAERLNSTILPALKEGAVVLADRWVYTALARDSARGMDAAWLRELYSFAPKPDLALYFKLPVEAAIGRVLARSEGRLGLSEELEGEPAPAAGPRVKHYEAGLDLGLAKDPVENFRLFQALVAGSYDRQVREFGLKAVDAAGTREEMQAAVAAWLDRTIGSFSSYKKRDDEPEAPNLFDKDPASDSPEIRKNYLRAKKGPHFYFRNMLGPMQARFAQLVGHAVMPRVFLHGNPHVDQYAKSAQGAAMVDFDRSRLGPYAWDLLRLLVSVSLRQKKPVKGFLEPEVAKAVLRGYRRGFRHPDRPFSEMRKLKDIEPSKDEATTDAYLAANKKWAREMRKDPVPTDHPEANELLRGYLESRGELALLDEYFVEEAGRGFGTMGNGRFLIVLAPKEPAPGKDRILVEIKKAFEDADTEWYKTPDPHHGRRMALASALHAPGWELRVGFATRDGKPYWARRLHTQNIKLKGMLDADDQEDFAYAVGTQLGRAHRLSLQDGSAEALEAHLDAHWKDIVGAGAAIRDELVAAHRRYLKKMKEQGLAVETDEDDDD